ncbi:DUF397 domain-containing protein [Nocardia anaemiae]|uniref:DUF397 domain-containing protein n=1 Tax=Nocardia anaemiae TaxID=263910 RepID=UPI0007A4FC73|nr:DUF397 domain-containing protein [Nocardia anaemiae]
MTGKHDDELSEARWFKSVRSSATKDCVEVAFLPSGVVGVRDSKNPGGRALVFDGGEWDAFTSAVADGKFNHS